MIVRKEEGGFKEDRNKTRISTNEWKNGGEEASEMKIGSIGLIFKDD